MKFETFDNALFFRLYADGLNWTQISKEINCSVAQVSLFAKSQGLKSRFVYGNQDHIMQIKKLNEEGLSDSKIAKLMEVSISKVQEIRSGLKLPINQANQNIILNAGQLGVMVGGLLGDSYLKSHKKYGASGGFAHSVTQEEYFLWKYELIKEVCGKIVYSSQVHTRTQKEYFKIYTTFKSTPQIGRMSKAFYQNGKKTIPDMQFIWDHFNDFSLAVWFGDDGSKGSIATMSFSKEIVKMLADLLYQKYNMQNFKIDQRNNLILHQHHLQEISEIVKPILPRSMHYKLERHHGPH